MSSRRQLAFCLPFLLVVATFGACKNEDPHPPTATGGISPPAPGADTEGGAQTDSSTGVDSGLDGSTVCTDLTLAGNLVDEESVAMNDPPAGLGGAITNGTYNLTAYSVYIGDTGIPGLTGISKRATIRISGGLAIEQIVETRTQTTLPQTQTFSSTFSAVAPTLSTTNVCPPVGAASYSYTATDSALTLTNLGTKEAFTYTLM